MDTVTGEVLLPLFEDGNDDPAVIDTPLAITEPLYHAFFPV